LTADRRSNKLWRWDDGDGKGWRISAGEAVDSLPQYTMPAGPYRTGIT